MVQAIPRPDPNLTPDPSMDPDPDPAINAQFAPPPNGMGWLGAIGGLLGVVSYTQGLITDLAKAFTPVLHNPNNENPIKVKFHKILKDYEKEHSGETIEVPEKKGDAPWAVAIQVGLDGTGLKVKRLQLMSASFLFLFFWGGFPRALNFTLSNVRVIKVIWLILSL